MPSEARFEEEDYSPSDTDEEYTEKEKQLLSKVRTKRTEDSDSEKEVFAVRSDESDSDYDDKSDLALSDVEGQDIDDDLPDVRAWGKDKRKYYKTDYVDADYGGFQGKDAHLAELEEEEARNLQKQLAQQLDDDDFSLELFDKKLAGDDKPTEELVKTDISKLSKRQKLQILQKESPEFFSLIEDFKSKMLIAKDFLHPVLQRHKAGQIPSCQAVDFVRTQYEIVLNYCMNIYMYLYLKSNKANVQNHPVIKRLYQYRQLLLQLEPVFEEIVKPQIQIILVQKDVADQQPENRKKKAKTLKVLTSLANKTEKQSKQKNITVEEENLKNLKKKNHVITEEEKKEKPAKKIKLDKKATEEKITKMDTDSSSIEAKHNEDDEKLEEAENSVSKRAITYKMAKNKGLTPHRKKEQRNPRVKHKLKYRKAIIRRKGAVREPRKELSKYSGEISGIKSTVTRSIKIKT